MNVYPNELMIALPIHLKNKLREKTPGRLVRPTANQTNNFYAS